MSSGGGVDDLTAVGNDVSQARPLGDYVFVIAAAFNLPPSAARDFQNVT